MPLYYGLSFRLINDNSFIVTYLLVALHLQNVNLILTYQVYTVLRKITLRLPSYGI
jgi:hypothetical protein